MGTQPSALPKKRQSPPIFGPFLLWPNGWMHQDATWYGARPQPRALVLDGDTGPSPKRGHGHPPQFSAHVYCGQTAGWIKMALGMEMGLGPSHIVLDGSTAPLPQKGVDPQFSLSPNGWMHQHAIWYGGRPQPRRLCIIWGPSFPSPKGAQPPVFVQCPLWPNDEMDEDATWYGSRPRPRLHCIRLGPSSARKGHSSPRLFGPCLLWPRSPISATAELLLKLASSM